MGKSELYKDDKMRIENENNRKRGILHDENRINIEGKF